ncbi:hypothetical protein AAA799D07_00334 [Marine Group I thaumarchaeote SCGC AAA799-D07]|nr:hypothetical protein AAA799D07_00334 [Marine Group I thaumarchaeote SCGC AAA799-D07]
MNFRRYFNRIQSKNKETKTEVKNDNSSEIKTEVKKTLSFVDTNKDPHEYLKRYLKEQKYKDWFNRNYPNFTIYEAVGLTASDYLKMKRQLFPESESVSNKIQQVKQKKSFDEVDFKPTYKEETKTNFDEFIDERVLVSHNAFGNKEMKIKIIEVSDEIPPLITKFGNRVKVNKILITIKHLDSQQIEEGEFDIEAIENELREKRHYASGNRWIPIESIKNGYVTNTRHTSLTSDSIALDYIIF